MRRLRGPCAESDCRRPRSEGCERQLRLGQGCRGLRQRVFPRSPAPRRSGRRLRPRPRRKCRRGGGVRIRKSLSASPPRGRHGRRAVCPADCHRHGVDACAMGAVGHARPRLGGAFRLRRPLLRRGVAPVAPSLRQYGHTRGPLHGHSLRLQPFQHVCARILDFARNRAARLFRSRGRHHRIHPLRPHTRSPGQARHLVSHQLAHGPSARHGHAGQPRRQRKRHQNRGYPPGDDSARKSRRAHSHGRRRRRRRVVRRRKHAQRRACPRRQSPRLKSVFRDGKRHRLIHIPRSRHRRRHPPRPHHSHGRGRARLAASRAEPRRQSGRRIRARDYSRGSRGIRRVGDM